jgi:tetratricopeptide (TPR) repeat protein
LLAKEPKDLTGRALKASILLEMRGPQNLKDAGAIATDLVKDAPGSSRIQVLGGEIALANGEFDVANARFQQAVRVDSRSTVPHLALARLDLFRKNFPAMLQQADAALTINSQDRNARLYRIMALTGTGSFSLAETEAEQLAKDTSNAKPVEMQLGIIALSQKKYAVAQEHFEKLYRDSGGQDVSPLAGLVSTLVAENNSDRALQLLQSEEKRVPDSSATQALTVATAQAAGKYDLALAELQKMATQNPKSAEVPIRMAELEVKRGNMLAAIGDYRRALQLDPQRKRLYAAIGSAQDQLGDTAGAIESYRKALAESPDNALIMNNLAYLLAETGGDLKEASRLASEGLRKAPDNPALKDTLGWVELQQGNTAAALPLFSSLTKKQPDNVTFLYHYGVALYRSGDRTAAKRQLESALAKQPPPPIEKDIRDLLAKSN